MIAEQEWTDACHRLKFVFGEYCFYSAWFEAAELSTHVTADWTFTDPVVRQGLARLYSLQQIGKYSSLRAAPAGTWPGTRRPRCR